MSRERDQYRLARTSILDVLNSNLRTSRTYTPNNAELYDYYPQSSNVRGSDNLSVEGAHESEEYRTSKSLNPVRDSHSLSSSRLGNVPMSSALDNLQNYGSSDRSPVHSQDWGLDFLKNVDSNKKASQISSGMKNYTESYKRSPESRYYGDTPSCSTLSDLNLKTVEEEDEFLYGDSNSLPEIPKSIKKDHDIEDIKKDHMWSDEDDLFQDSPKKKSNPEASRNTSVWNLRNKSTEPNSPQVKLQNQNVPVSRKMGSETMEPLKSSTIEQQKTKLFASNPTQEKNFVSDDMRVASGSINKSKYHAAAQLLKKQPMEKSRNLMNENPDSSHYDEFNVVKDKSFRSNVDEDKLAFKNRISSEDSKDFKYDEIPEKNARQLPKAFLEKDQQGIKNYIKGSDRKRVYSQEGYETELKHPRYNSPRDSSPKHSPYDSSRHRSPVDDYRYRPSSYSMHKPHPSDFKYRYSPYSHHKSPPRDYERHSYELSPRRDKRKRYSRSPRRSRERSPGYYKYKEKIPMKRSRERSRSPVKRFRDRSRSRSPMKRSRERSRSPMKRSQERSRSPGYYKSRDSSLELQYKKKSYKSYEMPHKGPAESHPKQKKKKDYSSGDSFCSLSLGSESDSSDRSSNSYNRKEKHSKSRSKKTVAEDSNVDNAKVEAKSDAAVVKDVDKPIALKGFAQNLEQICHFKDKTSEATEITDNIPKLFNKDEEDKLFNIVKMFENSQILSELVEGVQDSASSLASSMVDTSQNLTMPVQNPAVINMPFPHSYPVGPVQPNVPIHYPPSQVPPFPPLAFRPPLVMQAPPPTSMLAPFPQPVHQSSLVEVPRIPDMKQMAKKRPQTLRPISLQKANENTLSSPQKHIETKEIKDSKDNVIVSQKQEDKTASELSKLHAELIEKYKKLKAERHLVRIKVNSSVGDLCEMRKIMDETWGKKKTASDAVIHSKCKHILSISQDNLSSHVKEAKRLEDELNRLKGKIPKELQTEISNIKIEPAKEVSNVFYSGFDNGSHTCFICYQQFQNLSSILEHFQSKEHMEQMDFLDKEWKNNLSKHTELEAGKKLSLKPVQGIEFMKPLTGFYCTICSETIFDNSSAESHLKSHDHFVNFNDYILKHPLYERKCLLKSFVMHSKKNKLKEMQAKEEQLINRKKLEAVEEKVKEMIKDQVSKEKVVDELKDNDDKAIASNNQNSGGIKLTLSGENEKAKEDSKEKDTQEKSTSKTAQKRIYIGKAPNFKSRPKPWYKREIYQKNESESDSSSPSLSKESVVIGNVSFPDKKSLKIDSKTKPLEKTDQSPKKTVEYTCLTEEASEKLPVVSGDSSKEKLPLTKDPVVNQAIKNILLGTDSSMHKDIPLSEIKLPDIPVQTANDSSANPTSQGESRNPLPMEIEESPEAFAPVLPPTQKLTAEEEKDFFILGINREDFRPLVVPVPPPSSLMNPNFYKVVPPPTVVCNAKTVPPPTLGALVCDTSVPPPALCDTSVPPPNFNINIAQAITVPPPPLSISTHLTNALNSKQQSPEFKHVKSNPNLIRIVPTKTLKLTDSPTKTINKNVDATTPVKLTDSPTKTVKKNEDATTPIKLTDSPRKTLVKLTDSPTKTVNKNHDATIPIKLTESPRKTPVKLTDSPSKIVDGTNVKNIESSAKNDFSRSLDKKLESSKVCLKSNENISCGTEKMPNKKNSSQSSETSLETSKPDLSEVKNIKCETLAKLSVSVDNLSRSESIIENEAGKESAITGNDSSIEHGGQDDAYFTVSFVSKEENKSSSIAEVQNKKQVKSEICEIISEISKSVSSEIEDVTKSDSITNLTVPSDNLIQSESAQDFIVDNRDTASENKRESILESNENSCSIIRETLNKEEGLSQFCEFVYETSDCNSSGTENIAVSDSKAHLIVKKKDLSQSESVKHMDASVGITSENESTLKCDTVKELSAPFTKLCYSASSMEVDDSKNYVSEKIIERSNTSDEKQVDTTSKESLIDDDDDDCCIIGEIVNEVQSLSTSYKTDLEASKSDLSKIENIIKREAVSPLRVLEDTLSESEMEIEADNRGAASGKVAESLVENKLNISSKEIQDSNSKINSMSDDGNTSSVIEIQMEGQVASVKIENISETSVSKIGKGTKTEEIVMETNAKDVSIISEKDGESIETYQDTIEGQIASVQSENISETPVASEIEKVKACEEITSLNVPADNFNQSDSVMETDSEDVVMKTDAEGVSIISEKDVESIKTNQDKIEGQVASVKSENISETSVTSEVEKDKVCKEINSLNVPAGNFDQSVSVMETDAKDVVIKTDAKDVSIISEKDGESIKTYQDKIEGKVASVKCENISETPVTSEIEKDKVCEEITSLNFPADNFNQSESIMETDAEDVVMKTDAENIVMETNAKDVSTLSEIDGESIKTNQDKIEGQVASVKCENISETLVASEIEKDKVCEEITSLNVPANNLNQSDSVMETDAEDVVMKTDAEDVSIISEKGGESIKTNQDKIEGQVTSVKCENISETAVTSEIEKDKICDEITSLHVPTNNLNQSESIMKTDAEDGVMETDAECNKINWEDSTKSPKNSISGSVEGQRVIEQNVPEMCRTVSETLKSDAILENSTKAETVSDISVSYDNLSQTKSAVKTDLMDIVTISENTSESIKDESFNDYSNKTQNVVPIQVCVTNEENSCSSVVKSTVEEESELKTCEFVPKSCESMSSEIESTLKNVTVDELSAPISKFCVSASAMDVGDDSTNVVSEKVDESVEKCIIQDFNSESSGLKSNKVSENSTGNNFALPNKESSVLHLNLTASSVNSGESVICKESDNKANIFLDDTICETEKQFDSKTIDSEAAQSCIDANPHQMLKLQVCSKEKSDMEVSPSMTDSIQVRTENSTELNENFDTKQLDKDSLSKTMSDIEPVSVSYADGEEKFKTNGNSVLGQTLQEELPAINKSDMEICSSTIQELIHLKEAQQSNEELDLATKNCEGSTEIKKSLSAPESGDEIKAVPENETSGSTQEVSHHESSAEVILKDQDPENKVIENEGGKTLLRDNVDETEILSKSDTDTEEYEEEQ